MPLQSMFPKNLYNYFFETQMRSIWRNQTGIEDWIIEKANYRRKDTEEKFVHPYDLVIFFETCNVIFSQPCHLFYCLLRECGII